tara:strand:+ start:383 stop:664 length:282 start_codon:yes stop_codon:yes gene_type:complete
MTNNFFGGGIGGTVTPRTRGGAVKWHGGLGSEARVDPDAGSYLAGVGTAILAYYVATRMVPKAKRKFDSAMKAGKPAKAFIDSADAMVSGVIG